MTDEIANEPTRAQMLVHRRDVRKDKWLRRAHKIEDVIVEFGGMCNELLDRAIIGIRRRRMMVRVYLRKMAYSGQRRARGRAPKRVLDGRRYFDPTQEVVTRNTPEAERRYDENTETRLVLSPDWSRKLQTRINNASLINSGAAGPLAKE